MFKGFKELTVWEGKRATCWHFLCRMDYRNRSHILCIGADQEYEKHTFDLKAERDAWYKYNCCQCGENCPWSTEKGGMPGAPAPKREITQELIQLLELDELGEGGLPQRDAVHREGQEDKDSGESTAG